MKKIINFKNIIILFCLILVIWAIERKLFRLNEEAGNSGIEVSFKNETDSEVFNYKNNISKEEDDINVEEDDREELDVKKEIPGKIFISVPFTSQAPFAVWDEIHEEACEEASLVMLRYFFLGKELDKTTSEKEIQALVDFQNKKSGDYRDTTAQETADLFLNFYGKISDGKKMKVVYDFKKEELKNYLSKGFPIIIPAAGRELGNPNFTAPGPLYHNLVLVGYDGDTIITNDPGTKKGESYKYDIDIIYNAIHDFPGKPENINQGRKAMIVIENE